jgi:AraC-like DNA-binding protein
MISLKYEPAHAELAHLITTFYHFIFEGGRFAEIERADRAQLRIYLKGTGGYKFKGGNFDTICDAVIIGPTTGPVEATGCGPIDLVGWGITPGAWSALMGANGAQWTDRAFDARNVFGDAILDVRQKLIAAPTSADKFAVAKIAAGQLHPIPSDSSFEFTDMVDAWLISSYDPQIEHLIISSRLSIRQLERTTRHYYGMPPKKLARKYRALRAAQLLSSGVSLDDSGLSLAFYDQSHLIREIKYFTGLTPSQLRSGSSILTATTMKNRSALFGHVNPLVSQS